MNKYISMAAAAVAALAVASPIAADAQVVVPAGQNQPYYPTGIGPAISGSVTTGRSLQIPPAGNSEETSAFSGL
ncbi:MAG: hypothetical protein HFJ93_02965 [Muribaculaceae bacterium]|nr:hypothetical protein [Muribaculaceae bacterium]